MALPEIELRILGALMEKEHTTPDAYPLSAQALVSACNQRTSRDPVTDYHLQDVLVAASRLQDRGLLTVVRMQGDRVAKHRHRAAEALDLDVPEIAVLAVLILRGEQTPGELRSRTERYVTLADTGAVEAVLRRLAERQVPLVKNLGRTPGQSQDRWSHTLGIDEERLRPRVRDVGRAPQQESGAPEREKTSRQGEADGDLEARLEALERRVTALEAALEDLGA